MPDLTRRSEVPDEAAMQALGARVGARLRSPLRVYLHGALGAGKTTLVRGMLRGMGYEGGVRSPTYTLLELYETPRAGACHMDLYRLESAREIEDIGARDYLDGDWCCFVEWPERGATVLPAPDLAVELSVGAGPGDTQRTVSWTAGSEAGMQVLGEALP